MRKGRGPIKQPKKSKSKMGMRNPQWRGDDVKYASLHLWVQRHKPKPAACVSCGKLTEHLELSNISGRYLRDINDYKYECRSCHMKKDGRIKNLKQYQEHEEYFIDDKGELQYGVNKIAQIYGDPC